MIFQTKNIFGNWKKQLSVLLVISHITVSKTTKQQQQLMLEKSENDRKSGQGITKKPKVQTDVPTINKHNKRMLENKTESQPKKKHKKATKKELLDDDSDEPLIKY